MRTGDVACEVIPSGSDTWNDTTPLRDRGDVSAGEQKGFVTPNDIPKCELNQIIHDAYQSIVKRDKESPVKTNSGGDTNISSDVRWEFLMKSYNDLGYGNWTAGTTTVSLDHDDKDQGVGSGAT